MVLGSSPRWPTIFFEIADVCHARWRFFYIKLLEKDVFVQQVDDFMSKLYAKTMELGGQISGEHGIGRGKIKYLAQAAGPTNIALMQGIKKVFDPKLLLNPGKVFTLPEA